MLQLLIGSSAISLGLLLAIYMGGLCLGSVSVSVFISRRQHPLRVYALLELGIGILGILVLFAVPLMSRLYVAGPTQGSLGLVLRGLVSALCLLAKVLPYWPIDPWLALTPWPNFQLDLVRTTPAISPATLLWGASFPLALAALVSPEQDPARLSGEAYAANCAGAIIGALLFTLVFIPGIGTLHSQQLLIGMSALAAVMMFVSWRARLV